ncbi:MAG TPA: rhodanese-like domain-containing protein [Gammaproteobacteria bacterium]|nr:rhodanese-like domain-containing protein [Gammaproteobacteria bacterium]
MGQFGEFLVNQWVLVLAFVLIVGALIVTEMKRKLLGFRELAPQDAVRLMNSENAVVVDMRDDKEYGQGHIIDALHIPLGLLENRLQELAEYKDRPLLVYCRTGQRSAQAAVTLRQQGFEKLYKLKGGMLAWQEAGLPVVKAGG